MKTIRRGTRAAALTSALCLLFGASCVEDLEQSAKDADAGVLDLADKASAITYQAEAYTLQSGCAKSTKHPGYTDAGFVDFGGNGTYLEWSNVNVPTAGQYILTFRYANGSTANRQCAVTINDTTNGGNVGFATTGAWTTWNTQSIKVYLRSGNNKIRVTANTGSGGPNLDKLDLMFDGATAGPCTVANEGSTANLQCPSGQVISSITFASYGTPTGACPTFSSGACHATTSKSKVESLCLGKQSCTVGANNSVFGDPCGGVAKRLAVTYGCNTGTVVDPPGTTVLQSTVISNLPDGLPNACEYEWTVRTLHYDPGSATPRRMYTASCQAGSTARMFTSLTLGPNAPHPQEDPTSGGLIVSELDSTTGALKRTAQKRFAECKSMHGVAVSQDCQTIGVLCRIASGTQGFDKDVVATHPSADWMTNPYVCGSSGLNDEMWLYEWNNGNVQTTPKKYIVHKSIGSWEYGNDYLRLSHDKKFWGIGVKATVGGKNGPGTCHEADALLIMDRQYERYTTRGWSWACGTGHTTMNRFAYDSTTGKFAALCSTDYNEKAIGGLGAYVFRMEDGKAQEFHYLNLDGIKNKGGASAIVPRTGGGFLGLIVGVPGAKVPGGYPDTPPTEIGLVRFSATGEQQGDIRWIRKDPNHYLSYSTLSVLAPNRYLLGWGVMRATNHTNETGGDNSYRVPWEYWVAEIDENGQELSKPVKLAGAGWGELDEMAPLGSGQAGWTYIDNPALNEKGEAPACGQNSLELSVYRSSNR